MPNTPLGYPYPANTDPVAQGAAAIQSLATAADTKAGVSASGQVDITIVTTNTQVSATVTFPAGRFTAAPRVVTQVVAAVPQNFLSCVNGITATGATVWLNRSATAGTSTVMWYAFQV